MLKAGFARVEATPPLGADLSGYFHRRLAKGILDPLYLNAVALSNDDKIVLLISADYIGIKLESNIKIRKMISERTGVELDNILIAALHQHTSCAIHDAKGFTAICEQAKKALNA